MTRISLVCIVIIICICSYKSAYSDEQVPNGTDLLVDCSLAFDMIQDGYVANLIKEAKPLPSEAQQKKAMQCLSYVIGFRDALLVSQIFQEKNAMPASVCLNDLNNQEALRVVLKYVRDNPQLLSRPQSALVFNAFFYAFPCRK